MSMSLLAWLVGGAVLLAAGFVSAYLPRRRARQRQRLAAWSSARAAIAAAAVSRDACPSRVPEAEQLLARAESIAAERGGPDAASTATECAERADRLWREARDA